MVEPAKVNLTPSSKDYDILAKVLMVGDSNVGKSRLLLRFAEDNFPSSFITTVGIDYKVKTVYAEGKNIKMQIWDTAGQERFKTITQTYYRGAAGIFLVFACNDRDSFNNITTWVQEVDRNAREDACKILVGNNCDFPNRDVSRDEARAVAESFGLEYVEVSDTDKIAVDEMFYLMAQRIVQRRFTKDEVKETEQTPTSTGDLSQTTQEKKGCFIF